MIWQSFIQRVAFEFPCQTCWIACEKAQCNTWFWMSFHCFHKGFFCIVQAVETVEHAIINRDTVPSNKHSPSFVFPGIHGLLDQKFFQFIQTEIAVFPVNVFVIHFIYARIIKFESFMLTRVCVICTIFWTIHLCRIICVQVIPIRKFMFAFVTGISKKLAAMTAMNFSEVIGYSLINAWFAYYVFSIVVFCFDDMVFGIVLVRFF